MFANFFSNVYSRIAKFPFDGILLFVLGSFAAFYVVILLLNIAMPVVRESSKKPFLCLVNCYAVIVMELFLCKSTLSFSVFAAGVFWLAGYLLYGFLCAISRIKRRPPEQVAATVVCPAPQTFYKTPEASANTNVGAAKNNVKLEHAMAVTDKLLEKNLGKSDRQQLEKLKTTLEVLQVKGDLTPAEGEILNENFNALLKLMAKYNI